MRIAILGTRGIPNQYGGFEQFADILSQGLVKKGHEITVYCSKEHVYRESDYLGVKLIHKFDPEIAIGTVGQFIYDLLCILDARKQKFDIIYLLGYTSSSVWQKLIYKKGTIIITNMDGLEWKRSKYSSGTQKFLKYAEKLAIKYSDFLVSDSLGIQKYLLKKHQVSSIYLPYGSYVFDNWDENVLIDFKVTAYNYDILIARFEQENNIEMILKAYRASDSQRQLLLVGNYKYTAFGRNMFKQYSADVRIRFMGAIYDSVALNNLRYFSNLYFHGHSVGGTNPSLLEAMGSYSLICYHDNEFNKAIVGEDGFAFKTENKLCNIINSISKENEVNMLFNNIKKITNVYSWEKITNDYEAYFEKVLTHNGKTALKIQPQPVQIGHLQSV